MHPTSNRRQSANISVSSACRSSGAFSDSPTKQKPEEVEVNVENSIGRLPNHTDSFTFVERMASESSIRVVLSSRRQKAVAALPPVLFNVNDRHLNNTFDRDFLKITLGKPLSDRSVLPFVFLVTSSDFGLSLNLESSRKQTIASYLCPTLKHHPWCPSRTGDHGFIFVGLGKDKDSYRSVAIRNLFVGLPKTAMDRRFRYLGRYQVTRVEPLSVDEWTMFSAEVNAASRRHKFCNLTWFFFFFKVQICIR